jgi:O-antigen/teichoic acid export membrane protein
LPLNTAEREREVARRILVNTFYRSVADIGSKIASLALFIVMARKLGDTGFGVFTFGLTFVTLVTTLGGFGQDAVLTREVAREPGRLAVYFANTIALNFILALPALALASFAYWLFGGDRETLVVILFLGVAVIAELLMSTCFATFQAHERMGFIPVVLILQRFVTAAVGIAALILGAGVVAVSAVYLGGALLAFVVAVALQFGRVARPHLTVDPARWSTLMAAAFPIGLFAVFALTLFRIDTAILAAFEPTRVVGDYGVAYRLLEATLFLSWSVGAAVYPVLSRFSRTNESGLALVYSRALKLVIALTLPLAVGAAVLGESLVHFIYGSEFDEAGLALVLLAPTVALYPVAYVSGSLLVSQDRQRILTKVYGIVTAQNILGNLVLIPWLSLYGAALETSISQLLLTIWLIVSSVRTIGSLDRARVVVGPTTAAGVAAVAMLLTRHELALAVASGAAAYLVVLTAFEFGIYPEDARTIKRFVFKQRV